MKKGIFSYFLFQPLLNDPVEVRKAVNRLTYIGILPTHKALHPSSFRHWPVDLSEGERGIFYSCNVIYITGIYEISGISTHAKISPVGIVITQLQHFNDSTLEK